MQAYSAVSNGYVENQMKSIYRTSIEILKKKKESKTNKIFKTEICITFVQLYIIKQQPNKMKKKKKTSFLQEDLS